MRTLSGLLIVAALCMGCPLPSHSPESTESASSLLTQADAKMVAEDYSSAQGLYGQFVTANPGDAQAGRARAIQAALERLLASQAELGRVQRGEEVVRLKRELSDRQSEVDRLKAEVTKLRADLERLRNIDLKK